MEDSRAASTSQDYRHSPPAVYPVALTLDGESPLDLGPYVREDGWWPRDELPAVDEADLGSERERDEIIRRALAASPHARPCVVAGSAYLVVRVCDECDPREFELTPTVALATRAAHLLLYRADSLRDRLARSVDLAPGIRALVEREVVPLDGARIVYFDTWLRGDPEALQLNLQLELDTARNGVELLVESDIEPSVVPAPAASLIRAILQIDPDDSTSGDGRLEEILTRRRVAQVERDRVVWGDPRVMRLVDCADLQRALGRSQDDILPELVAVDAAHSVPRLPHAVIEEVASGQLLARVRIYEGVEREHRVERRDVLLDDEAEEVAARVQGPLGLSALVREVKDTPAKRIALVDVQRAERDTIERLSVSSTSNGLETAAREILELLFDSEERAAARTPIKRFLRRLLATAPTGASTRGRPTVETVVRSLVVDPLKFACRNDRSQAWSEARGEWFYLSGLRELLGSRVLRVARRARDFETKGTSADVRNLREILSVVWGDLLRDLPIEAHAEELGPDSRRAAYWRERIREFLTARFIFRRPRGGDAERQTPLSLVEELIADASAEELACWRRLAPSVDMWVRRADGDLQLAVGSKFGAQLRAFCREAREPVDLAPPTPRSWTYMLSRYGVLVDHDCEAKVGSGARRLRLLATDTFRPLFEGRE